MLRFFNKEKEQQSLLEKMPEPKKVADCLDKSAAAAAVTGVTMVGAGACVGGLTHCAYPLITSGITLFGCITASVFAPTLNYLSNKAEETAKPSQFTMNK